MPNIQQKNVFEEQREGHLCLIREEDGQENNDNEDYYYYYYY